MAEVVANGSVHIFDGGVACLHQVKCLAQERVHAPIGDEPSNVAAQDRGFFAPTLRQLSRALRKFLVGPVPADDFHETQGLGKFPQ